MNNDSSETTKKPERVSLQPSAAFVQEIKETQPLPIVEPLAPNDQSLQPTEQAQPFVEPNIQTASSLCPTPVARSSPDIPVRGFVSLPQPRVSAQVRSLFVYALIQVVLQSLLLIYSVRVTGFSVGGIASLLMSVVLVWMHVSLLRTKDRSLVHLLIVVSIILNSLALVPTLYIIGVFLFVHLISPIAAGYVMLRIVLFALSIYIYRVVTTLQTVAAART